MTSEIKLHLAIMKERPEIKSVVHCHPPHATAFGIAREPVPMCVLPEVEVFLGDVPIAKYETPGSQEFADTILPFVHKSQVIILANHGTVSFGETVERAYWWTEILDAYCRMLMLARGLGSVHYFSEPEERALLNAEAEMGHGRPAAGGGRIAICAATTPSARAGRTPAYSRGPSPRQASATPAQRGAENTSPPPLAAEEPAVRPAAVTSDVVTADQEALIAAVTERVIAMLENRG